MHDTRTRLTALLVVASLAVIGTPAASFARPGMAGRDARRVAARARVAASGVGATWAASATPDPRDPADDRIAGAIDYTNRVYGLAPVYGYGKQPYEEKRSIRWASNDSTLTAMDARGDQDWFKFKVSAGDTLMGKPYLIEAKAWNGFVDPVIEVYGPVDASHTIAPSDPRAIWSAGGATDRDIDNTTCVAASDNGPWFGLGYSASAWFMPAVSWHDVWYYVRVRPAFGALEAGGVTFERGYLNAAGRYTVRLKAGTFTRIAGDTRVQTAVSASRERYASGELPIVSFDGTGTVVIASKDNYPDALAGSTLAGASG
jgi:hypothetical protein